MRYENVCLESFGYTLPAEVVTSEDLEHALGPFYERLGISAGRLELMTGIRERRFWPTGSTPSQFSIPTAAAAIEAAGIDRQDVGALVHASVCRDFLEPATASVVHDGLGLASDCLIYDLSNACLGFLDGIVQLANMIELGQIPAGVVVSTETARGLVENTVRQLNEDTTLTREDMKRAMASLTIGSASVAAVLVDRRRSLGGTRIRSATARAATRHVGLCQSRGGDEPAADGFQPLMDTDSERLLVEGVAAAGAAFEEFLDEAAWQRTGIERCFCHQVGVAHQKLLFAELDLDLETDFATVGFLGNTGSAALPVTMAIAAEQGKLDAGDRAALLGIGSGINVLMLAAEYGAVAVAGNDLAATDETAPHETAVPIH